MFKVLDSHTHTYPEKIASIAAENLGKFYNFTVSESGTLSSLEDNERQARICGFLLLPVATSARNVDKINSLAAEDAAHARKNGFLCQSFGAMHQDYPDFAAGVSHIKQLGLKGIKLHPDLQGENVDSDRFFELYKIMQSEGLILYLHVGDDRPEVNYSSPERVARVAQSFPGLSIVAAHLGGYRVWDSAERILMGRYENVWYDCSSTLWAMDKKRGKYLIEKCGTERVFFGSDFPAETPRKMLDEFMGLDFSDPVRQDILYNNLYSFIGFGE